MKKMFMFIVLLVVSFCLFTGCAGNGGARYVDLDQIYDSQVLGCPIAPDLVEIHECEGISYYLKNSYRTDKTPNETVIWLSKKNTQEPPPKRSKRSGNGGGR